MTTNDEKLVKHISENIGYFIAYEDLFSTWLSKGDDFDVSDVRDALSNFDINIEPTYKKLFENIFLRHYRSVFQNLERHQQTDKINKGTT